MQLVLRINGQDVVADILERKGNALRLAIGGEPYHFVSSQDAQGGFALDQEIAPGVWRRVQGAAWRQKDAVQIQLGAHQFTVADAARGAAAAEISPLSPQTPMPGLVRQVLVKAGQKVTAGDALAVIEAMKLQLTLSAGGDGVVEAVLAKEGDMVAEGVELVRVKAI